MKIAFYSPYLDTAGGGEKYILTAAEVLSNYHEVSILLDDHLDKIGAEQIMTKLKKLHGIEFSRMEFIRAPLGESSLLIARLLFLRKFDVLFYLTDGSIFYSTAKKSYLHFQVPLKNYAVRSYWGKAKLSSWSMAIYNSEFTKTYIEKDWPIKGRVLYPPVSTGLFNSLKKKKQIISVGRFFDFLKDKKQAVLIDVFKELVEKNNLNEWRLYLVGAASDGDKEYINKLRQRGEGYKISILPNLPLERLKKLYGESYIYWHASGFGEDEPAKMEHFGIAIVESMAAGCIPIVVNKGGAKEIIENGTDGFLWDSTNQFLNLTIKLINNRKLGEEMSAKAIRRSQFFSIENFAGRVLDLIGKQM